MPSHILCNVTFNIIVCKNRLWPPFCSVSGHNNVHRFPVFFRPSTFLPRRSLFFLQSCLLCSGSIWRGNIWSI